MQQHCPNSLISSLSSIKALLFMGLLTLVALLSGCSNKKNTALSRGYQRLSSHYNVYFNASEAFDAGIESVRNRYKNDYSHVLPVYEFSNPQAASAAKSDMETTLKKCTKLVQLHSITAKPKTKSNETAEDKRFRAKEEFNPYVPEAYLLMGKAQVVNHDEREAIKLFDYLSRKHEGERPTYESKIWKAIAYTQIGQYHNAVAALKSYDIDGVAPANLYADFQAAYANIYIAQGEYAKAIPYMAKAADETKDRHARRRYQYILAQLYAQTGDKASAAPLFMSLSRQLSDYDMAFAAKLDLATVAQTPDELATAEKTLKKMAKDPKNEEQLDQVYYAQGCLALGQGQKEQAKKAFGNSVAKSVSNDNQKGVSYLALADLYQAEPDYLPASVALDSAAFYLDDANERKAEATQRSQTLAPLAKELKVIQENDSLLRLARMDTKQRNKILDQMVKEHNDRLDAEREAREAQEASGMSQSDFYQLSNSGGSKSSWYFYNTQLVNAGKATFRQRWGVRKNEDNWRRSDKSSSNLEDLENQANPDSIAAAEENKLREEMAKERSQRMTREKLEANLPLTAQQQSINEAQTAASMLKAAQCLYNDVEDYKTCEEMLQEYLRRFGNSVNMSEATSSEDLYNTLTLLHFAQLHSGNTTGMVATDNKIKSLYPQSMMAKNLTEPNYLQNRQAGISQAEQKYAETYALYLNHDYAQVIGQSNAALQSTSDPAEIKPNYLLLRAMAQARQGNTTDFRTDLTAITRQYAGTPQDSLAQFYLAKLDSGMAPKPYVPYDSPLAKAGQTNVPMAAQQADYIYQPDSAHVIVCIVNNGRMRDAQFIVADYNFSNYLLQDYDIAMRHLPNDKQSIVIASFANKREAETYFYALREQPFWRVLTDAAIPQIYMMSSQNFALFCLEGLNERFLQFVGEHYVM